MFTRREVLKQSLAAIPLASLVTQGFGHGHVEFEKPPEDLRDGELQNAEATASFTFNGGEHIHRPFRTRMFLWQPNGGTRDLDHSKGLMTDRFWCRCSQPMQMMKTRTGHIIYYNNGAMHKNWGVGRLIGPTKVMKRLQGHKHDDPPMNLCLMLFHDKTGKHGAEFELGKILLTGIAATTESVDMSLCEEVTGVFESLVQIVEP